MSRILLLAFLFFGGIMHAQNITLASTSDDLQKVEEMKPEEIADLEKARAAVQKATDELQQTERRIAQQHGMKNESWMEWSSWTEIHGKYLLHYFRSSMNTFTSIR